MKRTLPEDGIQYFRDLLDVAEITAQKVLIETGKLKPYMTEREAGKRYGPAVVRRWIEEGLIKYQQDGPGCNKRIDRIQIEAVSKASNRTTFMSLGHRVIDK